MSVEMELRPEFGGRKEYNQTAQERLVGCFIVTDIIDDLLHSPVSLSLDDAAETTATFGPEGTRIARSFRFIEGELGPDIDQTLIEKRFDITYLCAPRGKLPSHETYTIDVRDMMFVDGGERTLMRNKYTIEYFGSERTSAIAIIRRPNFVDPRMPDMVRCATTPYDQRALHDEIARLCRAVDAGEQEARILAGLETEK